MGLQSEKLLISVAEIMRAYNLGLNSVIEILRNHGYELPHSRPNVKVPFTCVKLFDAEYQHSVQQQHTGRTIIATHKSKIREQRKKRSKESSQSSQTIPEEKSNNPNYLGGTRAFRSLKNHLNDRIAEEREKQKVNERIEQIRTQLRKNKVVTPQNNKLFTYKATTNTTISVEWSKIIFTKGRIEFSYNEKEYYVVAKESKAEYNHIIKTFAKRLSPINIKISESIASIIDDIEFDKVISILEIHNRIFNIENNGSTSVDVNILNSIPRELLYSIFPIDRTEYLEYLQELQDDDICILPVFETRQNAPDGFLFTLHRNNIYYIVWESSKHLARKATYVFTVHEDEVGTLHQLLFDFIISGIDKKRHYLRHNQVSDFFGIKYHYIDHNGFTAWKTAFDKLLQNNIKLEDKCKNENTVIYEVKDRVRTYTPVHNIIQNELKTLLEENGYYKNVLLESDNVDIKALTINDEWHYYEIKTSTARLCIREALGQILEYTHYNCQQHVTNLFIIGQYKPSDREINYISLLRQLYNLPIYYQWYDLSTHTLSNCY